MKIYKCDFDSAVMNWIPLYGGEEEFEQLDYSPMLDPAGTPSIRLVIFIGGKKHLIELYKGKGRFLNEEITEWLRDNKLTLKFQQYSPNTQIGLEFPTEEDEAMFLLKFG